MKNERHIQSAPMKATKQIISLLAITVLATSCAQARVAGGSFVSSFSSAPRPEDAAWHEVPARVDGNPKAICQTVNRRVSYAPDRGYQDEWQKGSVTWKRRSGDCEDMAQCVKEICDKKGVPADVYVFGSRATGRGHAVAIGNWKGALWMSSNGSYGEVTSVGDARQQVARRHGWASQGLETYRVRDPQLARGSMHGLEQVSSAEIRFVQPQTFVKPQGFVRPSGFVR